MIYDFFRNHQYFNDSDEDFFAGTGTGRSSGGAGGGPRPPRELIELGIGDRWKEAVQYVEIGNDGEQLDKRRYVSIGSLGMVVLRVQSEPSSRRDIC